MLKRVIAVLLLGCMLCLALAGCGKTDLQKSQEYMDEHPLVQKKLYSVSFCLVSDAAIDPVVLSAMQSEFNHYTETNYSIHVEFTNVLAADYADWLEAKFAAVEEAYAVRLEKEKDMNDALDAYKAAQKQNDTVKTNVALAAYLAAAATYYLASAPDAADAAAAAVEAAAAAAAAAERGDKEAVTSAVNAAQSAYYSVYVAAYNASRGGNGSLGSDIRDVYPEIAADQFDLIYVKDYDMLSSLVDAGRLRDLYAELTGKDYRLIKKAMTESYFDKAILNGKLYAVPNCRLLEMAKANYKYMRVNAAKAISLNFPTPDTLTDYESTEILRAGITARGENPDDYVQKNLVGNYAYRETLAEDGAWWVYSQATEQRPTINQSELFNSALAVTAYAYVDNNGTGYTADDDYCPAVKILYEIDTNAALHTILQYGALNMTYTLDTATEGNRTSTVVNVMTDEYVYEVAQKYTGNQFSLYPTAAQFAEGKFENDRHQNNDTVIKSDLYSINVKVEQPDGAECTVEFNRTFSKDGQRITMTAVPSKGYRFKEWTIGDSDDQDVYTDAVLSNFAYWAGYTVWTATFEKAPETTE